MMLRMKRTLHLLFLAVSCMLTGTLYAQDIPLFSQKLTNSFMYNPAVAGHTFGSATASYRSNYNVDGAPTNLFLSFHAPFAKHKAGFGVNVFQEKVTFLENTYASAAFAYHIRFDRFNSLSMGVSGEYNMMKTNGTPIGNSEDPEYVALAGGVNKVDFSFGMLYQTRFFKAGVAANRLTSTFDKEGTPLANYYTAYLQGLLPVRGGEDLLEPYVAYRKLSETNSTLDLGLFYTFNERIMGGVAWRSGNLLGATLGFWPQKNLMLGVTHEIIMGNIGGFVGSANEVTLRWDFNHESYKDRFRADYKSAMSYRRKTVSSTLSRPGSHGPKQLHKKQKKVAPYSPNKRYQNIKKLGVKTSQGYKRKSSPTRGRKHPPKRRR